MLNKLFYPISVLLVLWMVTNSIVHLSSSMDWDELDVASKLANQEYLLHLTPDQEKNYGIRIPDVIDPSKNVRNHFIATISALGVSKIFGVSKAALRAPSVLWALLIGVVVIAAQGLIGRAVSLFVLAHLSLNGLCLWYFHSMRGYASVLLLSTALFLLAVKWVEKGLSPKEKKAFIVLGILSPLTHAFGAIFFLILLPLIAFSWFTKKETSRIKELIPCALPVAFIGIMFISQFRFISRVGYLLSKQAPGISEPLLAVFGVREPYLMGSLAAALLLLAGIQISRKEQRGDFRFLTAAACWGFVIVALSVLKTSFFEPRFVLPFLVPTLIWVGSLTLRSKWGAVVAGVLFLVLPLLQQRQSIVAVQGQMKSFDTFVGHVLATVPAQSCYVITGESDQVYFSKSLFLKNATTCRASFHVHFGHDWHGEIPLVKASGQDYFLLLRDEEGRVLYELLPQQRLALAR